jgi:hypothetical protein
VRHGIIDEELIYYKIKGKTEDQQVDFLTEK